MLELRKLLAHVEAMSREMAARQRDFASRITEAREKLAALAQVDEVMQAKIEQALSVDPTWRGAQPVSARLDERHQPDGDATPATLIAVDGSQIYPDRHGLALYYLINIGSIILRQGTGEAPQTDTQPTLYFLEEDIYNDGGDLVTAGDVNARREQAELKMLAELAREERGYWGGDLDRLIVAMTDGPLLIWMGETDMKDPAAKAHIQTYIAQLQAIQQSAAIPIGYVDRPRSANVLRLLHVIQLDPTEISKERVRQTCYQGMTDRLLFQDLKPNQRSAIFAATTRINREFFRAAGQEIHFFYLNVAQKKGEEHARIVRVDAPAWVTGQPSLLDRVQQAIYEDCRGTEHPYVLARAHELAVVTYAERRDFEQTLAAALIRQDLTPEPSRKAWLKWLMSG
ncbi:MAG: DNA double-strand break repair nuclease NurA [Chloroflexi bacterium]|nr:DNA double-strand break repair nuclease NurA [Chloroflexota bacterium]